MMALSPIRSAAGIMAQVVVVGALVLFFGVVLGASDAVAINEEELRAFAKAYPKVTRIQTEYEAKERMASNSDKAQAIRQERQAKEKKAMKAAGLSRDDYQKVMEAYKTKEDVRRKVTQLIVENFE